MPGRRCAVRSAPYGENAHPYSYAAYKVTVCRLPGLSPHGWKDYNCAMSRSRMRMAALAVIAVAAFIVALSAWRELTALEREDLPPATLWREAEDADLF